MRDVSKGTIELAGSNVVTSPPIGHGGARGSLLGSILYRLVRLRYCRCVERSWGLAALAGIRN